MAGHGFPNPSETFLVRRFEILAGRPEAVVDGSTGFMVPARDPDALAEKIAYGLTLLISMHRNSQKLTK